MTQPDMFVDASDKLIIGSSEELATIVKMLPSHPLLKVYDVTQALGISEDVVYKWIDEGKFSVINRTGNQSRRWLIFRDSFLRFLGSRIIVGTAR